MRDFSILFFSSCSLAGLELDIEKNKESGDAGERDRSTETKNLKTFKRRGRRTTGNKRTAQTTQTYQDTTQGGMVRIPKQFSSTGQKEEDGHISLQEGYEDGEGTTY